MEDYLKGEFERSLKKLEKIQDEKLSKKSYQKLRRVLDVLLIGELYGLHTLKQILETYGIKSTNFYKLWQDFTFNQIKDFATKLSIDYFVSELKGLFEKSESTWSRSEITIVVDDSIFKQWLKNMPRGHYFDKFFSGQVKKSVYGFRVTLIGAGIGDYFYPLYFQIVPKGRDTKKVALKLLKKAHRIFTELSDKQGVEYPNLFLSADSGFTNKALIAYCEKHNIGYIGVPRKNNLFLFADREMNLTTFIEQIFLPKEEEYFAAAEGKGKKIKSFFIRHRAYFKSLGRNVTLLFFRLKGSKKVTVIFCQQKEVMAKTMRRRFFQRTKIELFFRFLKETLKIQKSKSERFGDFVKKLSLCILKAMFCIKFERMCRKKKFFRGWAFSKIRHHIVYQEVDKVFLQNALFDTPFA